MDHDVLEELYRRHYSAAMLYCVSLCGDEHMEQDFVSDAFVKACLSLPNDVPSFQYWLLRVCKNLWIDYLRKQKFLTSSEPLARLNRFKSCSTVRFFFSSPLTSTTTWPSYIITSRSP